MKVTYKMVKPINVRSRGLAYTDLCTCGETQTISHVVESCSLNGGLSQRSVDFGNFECHGLN